MPGRVLCDDAALKAPILLEARLALREALGPLPRDLLRLGGALCLERLLCLAQPLAPIACRAQALGQLVAPRLAVELVLGGVDPARLLDDLLGDLLVAAVRVMGRGRGDLRAVDATIPTLTSPARAQSESTPENSSEIACSWRARKRAIVA